MRTGVGKAHVDARFGGQLVQLLGPMVGDDGGPAHVALTVFDQDIEERVQRVQSSLLSDRTKALADQRLVGAFDNHCVVKVLVPQRRSQLDAVELPTEPAAVLRVGQ